MATAVEIEVGPGELVDRMTISRVKFKKLRLSASVEEASIRAITHQLIHQEHAWKSYVKSNPVSEKVLVLACEHWLERIHETLWELEDQVRAAPTAEYSDVELLSIYKYITTYNDLRARIKRKVDEFYNPDSQVSEVKSHEFSGEIDPDVFLKTIPPEFTGGIRTTV